MNHALSEAALPRAFRFSATACGLKKTGALDLALISSDVLASAAAVFTQNLVVAAPVTVSKANLRSSKGRMRAVIINAGNANCATGDAGSFCLLHGRYRRAPAHGKDSARASRYHAKSPSLGALLR